MSYSYNTFKSVCLRNIATSEAFSTTLVDSMEIPAGGHAVILSIMVCNKDTASALPVSIALKKEGVVDSCMVCKEVPVAINTVRDLLSGSKVVLNREDMLKAWTSGPGSNKMDLTVSYAIYTPAGF